MRGISHGEGRVTVKTYKDRNGGWGHFNKQMYDADDKGWSLEQAEWRGTDLHGMRISLFPASVDSLITSIIPVSAIHSSGLRDSLLSEHPLVKGQV